MSKDRRDKSKDTKPGGPDRRLDHIDWLIYTGQHDAADHEIKQVKKELAKTDPALKLNVRIPQQVEDNLRGRNQPAVRESLPGGSQSMFTEEEWGRIDAVARRLVVPMLEVGTDPDVVANRVIDDLGEDYGIPIGTSKDRKRLVRKVRDHVDRWVDRAA